MSSYTISSILIEKLGHRIEEIRLRALHNLISKLDDDYLYSCNLVQSKEILVKLCEWFSFDPCVQQESVLRLMFKILRSKSGETLIKHISPDIIIADLNEINSCVSPPFKPLLEEIIDYVETKADTETIVPPLDFSSFPQTSRSQAFQNSEPISSETNAPETTATPFDVFINEKYGTQDDDQGPTLQSDRSNSANSTSSSELLKNEIVDICMPHSILGWQPLVSPDRHVLLSIEESLENPSDSSTLLHSCRFFNDVLLQDFPAEIFLQRPKIVKLFHNLLNSNPSTKIGNAVVNCLQKLSELFLIRIKYYSDPSTHNLKQEKCTEITNQLPVASVRFSSNRSSPRFRSDDLQRDYYSQVASELSDNASDVEDSVLLQLQQLTLPHFCIQTLYYTFVRIGAKPATVKNSTVRLHNQEHLNNLLNLVTIQIKLLHICIRPVIWDFKSNPIIQEVLKQFNLLFNKLADTLEHSRLLVLTNEINPGSRSTHLHLLIHTNGLLKAILPVSKASKMLPQTLKDSLGNCLIDAAFARIYPQIFESLYAFVKDEIFALPGTSLSRYKDINEICKSMTAAVNFLKCDNYTSDIFYVIKEALPCVEYHKNLNFVKKFVELCVNKLIKWKLDDNLKNIVEDITLALLAHSDVEIKASMYATCHLYVTKVLGIDHVSKTALGKSGECLSFLWRSAVMIEIIGHGLKNDKAQIQRYAEDIILYILKAKFIVPDEIWDQIIFALIPAFPLLQSYADKTSALGRSIVKMIDPDIAVSIHLSNLEVIKGNLRLLFAKDSLTRNEALSRLVWILSTEENAKDKLPLLKALQGPILNTICIFDNPVDLTRNKSQTFYQVNSLIQVMELLTSTGIDPNIRKSAITQISVMLEDQILHLPFLEQDGLQLLLDILKKSLNEKENENFPDNVVPVIGSLKNLCLHNPKIRQEVALKQDIYHLITRALFLFSSDERLRSDAAQFLCLLLFSDFILTTTAVNSYQISIACLIADKYLLPFSCRTHWRNSKNTINSMSEIIFSDESMSANLRIHWNLAWFGGLGKLLNKDLISYQNLFTISDQLNEFNGNLRLNKFDFASLKYSSSYHCCDSYLGDIQNASTHQMVIDSTHGLASYLSLYTNAYDNTSKIEEDIGNLPWNISFERFLSAPPSSAADIELLITILSFLRKYISVFKKRNDKPCWITTFIKDPNHCLSRMIRHADESSSSSKSLNRELLLLITECALVEQQINDSAMMKTIREAKKQKCKKRPKQETWVHIVHTICENLKFSDTQHFYNLAFLDWLLCALVQITASLGWSDSYQGPINVKELRGSLVGCLTELIGAFHCGKGPAAATSLMGLSITRNSILTMNHLLCEMQNSNEKNWEKYWLCETSSSEINGSLQWLGTLLTSRDIILRAATLQLLAGLALSSRGATEVVLGLRSSYFGGVWAATLSILLDQKESSAVREQAATLLTNLSSHSTSTSADGSQLNLNPMHGPIINEQVNISTVDAILILLDEINFYSEIDGILSYLYVEPELKSPRNVEKSKPIDNNTNKSHDLKLNENKRQLTAETYFGSNSFGSDDILETALITVTPSLVKAVAWFITNLLTLDPQSVTNELNNHGLIRKFFRSLIHTTIEIKNSRSLVLYMDIVEMNSAICSLLTKAVSHNTESLLTVLHLRDCLYTLMLLLNTSLYYTNVPHLLFLRNSLWSQIFGFLTALLITEDNERCYNGQGHSAITAALNECGHEPFLEALCESISASSPDLQQSAISSLTSLLRFETQLMANSNESSIPLAHNTYTLDSSRSLQSVLDSMRSPRYADQIQAADANSENISPNNMVELYCRKLTKKTSTSKRRVLQNRNTENKSDCQPLLDFVRLDNRRIDKNDDHDEELVKAIENSKDILENDMKMAGAELCQMLIRLYNVHILRSNSGETTVLNTKSKTVVISALTSLLCVSKEAKKAALTDGLLELAINQMKDLHVRLSLESLEFLKRASDKKRICPVLNELSNILKMLTNFMLGNEGVKTAAVELGLGDMIHKLWTWFSAQTSLQIEALKMLCTFTSDCHQACQSIPLTSAVSGVGPRKTPTNLSLLHCIMNLVTKEVEIVNRSHNLALLTLGFHLLQNCSQSQECRILITKGNFLNCFNRVHPAITKRQRPWEKVEQLLLEFLETFTFYPEGQISVAKSNEALELVLSLTSSSSQANKITALAVLRNIAFCQANRSRLLISTEFLQILNFKLINGSTEEKCTCVTIIWSLAANSHKAKLVLKSSGLDSRLQDVLKQWKLSETSLVPKEQLNNLQYIIEMLKEGR